jgi:hypothetical protein
MKTRIYFALFASLTFLNTTAQEEDYLDIIAEKSCECIQKKKEALASEGRELTTTELGVCLFENAKDYKDRLVADYELDMTNLAGEAGERLGILIGSKMAFFCPDILMAAADAEEDFEYFVETGKVQEISSDQFIAFNIKDESGKTQKFYWLTFVNSSFDLQNSYSKLKDKQVEVEYVEQELFDPRINEYRKLNVITGLEVLN